MASIKKLGDPLLDEPIPYNTYRNYVNDRLPKLPVSDAEMALKSMPAHQPRGVLRPNVRS